MSAYNNPAATTGGSYNGGNNALPWHRWQDWVNLILGVWLFIAPWIWHSTTPTSAGVTASGWNAWILGVIVVVMALWALSTPSMVFPEWINVIAGIWLFISPWVLGFSRAGASSSWNQWVVGILVIIFAWWAASQNRGMGATTGSPRAV